MCYHACSLVGIHMCLVAWEVWQMICWIGYWECIFGVIHIISTCKKIVWIVEYIYLVGRGCLHVSCSSVSSTAASSSTSPDAHRLILVWGCWVLVCYIGGVNKLDRLAASPLGSVTDSLPWALLLLPKHCLSFPLVLGRRQDIDGGWNPDDGRCGV